jgi:hypothetical protein
MEKERSTTTGIERGCSAAEPIATREADCKTGDLPPTEIKAMQPPTPRHSFTLAQKCE